MALFEAQGVDYVFGLAKTSRLQEAVKDELAEAKVRHQNGEGGAVIPVVSSPDAYILEPGAAGGRQGRAPGQGRQSALHLDFAGRGRSTRSLCTSVKCARGTMENRLKEQQLDLYADRTSCTRMRSNQLRLYLSAVAYADACVASESLRGTAFAKATRCGRGC